MSKKPIIVFEGIEGSGKSQHISIVSKYLSKKKISHIKIREPGGNPNSEKIRKLILNNKSNFNKDTDLLLYMAARSENMSIIKRSFNKKIILIDRFTDSTIAYQHYGMGVDLNLIKTLNKYLLKDIRVSFTFLNIVNQKNLEKRLKQRQSLNRYDKFKMSFYNKVQKGFLDLSKEQKNKYQLINSNLDIYKNKKLPNKILLSGEKGIGKSTLAYHLINCILSIDEENAYDEKNFTINSNNKSFKLILNKSNPNFISIDIEDDKKSIDINQIRNLILSLNKSSFNTKPRLVLIDNIELLSINSVNALLKIVEEPNDNIYFILINNNKKILPTLKSRCLNYNIHLKSEESFDISNKILGKNVKELIHEQIISYYSTPGSILNLLNFAITNGVDLTQINLKDFIKMIINEKKYKKDYFIKHLLYSLIEFYFRQNVSLGNIKLLKIQNYFLKKINNTKIFKLDDEALLMEFDDRVLNG